MDLEEYLSRDEVTKQRYDFSAENATEKYAGAPSIEKYIIYKTYTSNSKWSDKFELGKKFRENIRNYYLKKEGRKLINWVKDPDDFKSNPNSLLDKYIKKYGRNWSYARIQ